MADQLSPATAQFFSSLLQPGQESGSASGVPQGAPSSGPALGQVDEGSYASITEKVDKALKFSVPAAAVGMVDSMLSSVGLVDDNRIGSYFTRIYPQFGDFYQNNKELAQGVGGAVGMLIPGLAATKLISGGNAIVKGATAVLGADSIAARALNSIVTSGKTYDELTAVVKARSLAAAEQGVVDMTSDARLVSLRSWIGRVGPATDAQEIGTLSALGAENTGGFSPLTVLALDRMKQSVAFEVGSYTFFNKNEFLYPSDQSMGELFTFNLGLAAAITAPELLFLNRALTRAVQDAAPIAMRALNPETRNIADVLYRDGWRDIGITQTAQVIQDLSKLDETPGISKLYQQGINKQTLSLKTEIADQVDKLGKETTAWGVPQLTGSAEFDWGHKGTIFAALEMNPTQLLGAKAADTVSTTMISHLENVVTKPKDLIAVSEAKREALVEKLANDQMRLQALRDPDGKGGMKIKDGLIKNQEALDELNEQLNALKSSEWFVLDPNQGVLLADRAKIKYNYNAENKVLKTARSENEPAIFYTPDTQNANTGETVFKQGFNELGFFNTTKLKTEFSDLGFFERSATFNAVNRALKEFNPGAGLEFNFGKSDGWLRFDYAIALEERNPGAISLRGTFPPDWQGTDRVSQLHWASLQDKFVEWNKFQDRYENQLNANFRMKPHQLLTPEDIRYQLNLPQAGLGETSPIEQVFASLRVEGQAKLTDAFKNFDDFKAAMQATQDLQHGEHQPIRNQTPELMGNSFEIATTKLPGSNTEIMNKPVLLVKQPLKQQDFGKDAIENAVMQVKAQTQADLSMATKKGATFVGALVDYFNGTATTAQARQLDELINGVTGSSTLTSQTFSARNNATLTAMLQLSQNSDQIGGKLKQSFFEPHKSTLTKLLDPTNAEAKMEWNLATQARQFRWDLDKDNPVKKIASEAAGVDEAGNQQFRYSYVLADTEANRLKLKQYFNEDYKDGMLMPVMTPGEQYRPLTIGQDAHDGMMAIADIGSNILKETNFLKSVLGKSQTHEIPIWTVPVDLTRPNNTIGYILRGDGKLKTTIEGSTPAEMNMKVSKLFEAMTDEERATSRFVSQKEVAANAELHDQVFGNLLDFSDPIAQTGKATGSTGLRIVDRSDNLLKNAINALDDQLDRLIARTRITYFESEVNRVRQMADASGSTSKFGNPTVWQQYLNAIEGKSDYSARTPVGQIYSRIESLWDKSLNALYSRFQTDVGYVGDGKKASKEFEGIAKELGAFSPWNDVQDFLKSTYKGAVPPTMRDNMNFITQFTSTAVLRFMEIGQGLNDILSIGATLPAVLGAVKRIPGEETRSWLARVGAYASPIADDIAIPNAARIATSTIHASLNDPVFQAAMNRAGKLGYFSERANDAINIFAVKGEDFVPSLLKRGWDAANYLTDKSFEVTRRMAFGAGYKLGYDGFGLRNEADLFTFAKKIADDTVGNYTARNKPQIFQGAVGMPLGLFQTWTTNYMQRLLGYVENKQYKNLAIQLGLQSAIFGGKTLPGMQQYMEVFGSSHDGINNPVDNMNRMFGHELTDLLLYGTISNIPKLWGNEGVAVYQRGDANVRIPGTLLDIERSAPAQLVKQVYGGIQAGVAMFQSGGNWNAQQTAEILSRSLVNRPLRHLFELAAGAVTDNRGQLISDEVYNGMSIASRVLGYRPLVETKEAEMMHRIQITEQSQQAKMARLEQQFRSAFRSGDVDGQAMAEGLRNYMEFGGNPNKLGQFLRNQFIISKLPRAEREFIDAMNDPTRMYDTLRMINANVPSKN